jgi:anti-sigma B factor antagonist
MEISPRKKGTVVILEISGDIDLYNASVITNMVYKLSENEKCNIVINLKDVFYIDSSGIGALISCLLHLKEHKMGMKMINVYASVKKIFELTSLTSFFDIYDSEEEAIKAFKH